MELPAPSHDSLVSLGKSLDLSVSSLLCKTEIISPQKVMLTLFSAYTLKKKNTLKF